MLPQQVHACSLTRGACLFYTPARLHFSSVLLLLLASAGAKKKDGKRACAFGTTFTFLVQKVRLSHMDICHCHVRAAGHASPAAHACEPDMRVWCTPADTMAAMRWAHKLSLRRHHAAIFSASAVAIRHRHAAPPPTAPAPPRSCRRPPSCGARDPPTVLATCVHCCPCLRHGSVCASRRFGVGRVRRTGSRVRTRASIL